MASLYRICRTFIVSGTKPQTPFWRQALRGCSQCAFQSNEITGVLFVLAAAVFNWRMALFFAVSVVLGTMVARLLRGNSDLLDLGLFGFNSGLMGLALANFFQPEPMLWVWMVIFASVTAGVAVALSRLLKFPFIAAPFILTFWAVWALADGFSLSAVDFGDFADDPVRWGKALLTTLGAALFTPSPLSGAIFLGGIAVSNWRHAVVAFLGALIADALAAHVGAAGQAINLGFVGFNGVLAALAAYVLIAPDLRFVALAAVLATWLFSFVNRSGYVPVLASGFVLAIWLILLLGWLNPWFAGKQSEPKPSSA
jgi:urea transporter